MTDVVAREWRWNRGAIDKWAFFLFFVLGALVIVGTEVNGLAKAWAVVICVGLMFIYASAVFWLPRLRLRLDQMADNCYYLGLLFTLSSLGVALYRFAGSQLSTDTILRNFGIAIATTIAGLALRVFIGQFREDPDDLERETRIALSETATQIRSDLDQALTAIQQFTEGVRQAVKETSETIQTETATALAASLERFDATLAKSTNGISDSISDLKESAGAFKSANTRMGRAVSGFADRLDAINVDSNLVSLKLQPAFDLLTASATSYAKTLDDQGGKVLAGSESFATAANSLGALKLAAESLAESSAAIRASADALNSGAAGVEQLRTSLTSAIGSVDRFADGMTRASGEVVDRTRAAVGQLDIAVQRLPHGVAEGLESVRTASAGVIGSMNQMSDTFAESGNLVKQVRDELTTLAGWIIERLDRGR